MTIVEDVMFEAGEDLAILISAYWKARHAFERAVLCDNPGCHHADMDRAAAVASYTSSIADICDRMVNVIEEAM